MAVELFKLQLIYYNLAFKRSGLVKLFLLATTMAAIPCLNLLMPIDGCDPSWTIEATEVRLNSTDLDAAFKDLMAASWLINGYETLSIGRDAARAVIVLKKLGFPDAMGLYRSCAYLFGRRQRLRALPFHDGSFDFVFATEMIDGVRVPARLVLEMERVLKPSSVGIVMRRVSENFPVTSVMKAAAPVAAFLTFSDVVAVRTINRTVMVVFKKRAMVAMERKKDDAGNEMTKRPRDSYENYVGTYATLKKKKKLLPLSKARKIMRDPITEVPLESARNNVGTYGTSTKKQMPLSGTGFGEGKGSTSALITETPLGKKVIKLFRRGTGNTITEMPLPPPTLALSSSQLGGYAATLKKQYLLNLPAFRTKKRYANGG